MRVTLGRKLGLVFGALIIMFGAIVGVTAYYIATGYMKQSILMNNQQTVVNVNDYYLDKHLSEMVKTINYWSVHPNLINQMSPNAFQSDNYEVIESEWKSYLTLNETVSKIYFVSCLNDDLLMIPVKTPLPEDYNPKLRIWYKGAMMDPNKIYWSPPYRDAERSQDMVVTLSKVVKQNGESIGVIGIDIRLSDLSRILEGVYANQAGYLVLTGPQGQVFAHPNSDMLGSNIAGLKWADQVLVNKEGNGIYSDAGKQYVYSYLTLKDTNWKLVGIQVVNFSAIFDNLKYMSLFTLVMVALVMLLGGYLAARFILKPLRKMMETIQSVSEGHMEARSSVTSKDEIGAISHSFNHMLDQIAYMNKERDKNLDLLLLQNSEISEQKQEIHSLYEITDSINHELEESLSKVNAGYLTTVKALANAIEANDHYTRGHCERVSQISLQLGAAVGLTEFELKDLEFASILHDIGKIGVPSHIINKPSRLTDDEFKRVQQHPTIGSEILSGVSFLNVCSQIVCQHHERIDGKGYPAGLKGAEILPAAKVLAIADSYDAMTSNRPYREAPLTHEKAISELKNGCGTQFDCDYVEAFAGLIQIQISSVTNQEIQNSNHLKAV